MTQPEKNSKQSSLTPREKTMLWFTGVEHDVEDRTDHEELSYLHTVHIVALWVGQPGKTALISQPLSDVIELLNKEKEPDEQIQEDEVVVNGCISVAKRWNETHPGSIYTKPIIEQALQAQMGYHAGLFLEMFIDFADIHPKDAT